MFQIESFCDRLILTAKKRSIDELAVGKLLKELYPKIADKEYGEEEKEPYGGNLEAMRIADVLKKYGGNREKAAKELGISKATLWRHRKKYGIE